MELVYHNETSYTLRVGHPHPRSLIKFYLSYSIIMHIARQGVFAIGVIFNLRGMYATMVHIIITVLWRDDYDKKDAGGFPGRS